MIFYRRGRNPLGGQWRDYGNPQLQQGGENRFPNQNACQILPCHGYRGKVDDWGFISAYNGCGLRAGMHVELFVNPPKYVSTVC